MPKKPKEEKFIKEEVVAESSEERIEENIRLGTEEVTFDEDSDEEELENLEE